MLSRRAVRKFLDRKLPSYLRWKKFTYAELRERKNRLPVKPPIWKKLTKRQRVCFLIGATKKAFAFFLDTGCGKTLLTISLGRYFRKTGELKKMLVLVPNQLNKYEWAREINKHSPGTRYVVLHGSSSQKWVQLNENSEALFCIATYGGMLRMVCDLVLEKKRGKLTGNKILKLSKKKVRQFIKHFDGYALDESTEVQSRTALASRIIRQLAKRVSIRFVLTGTPFGKDPTPLWNQLYLTDLGATLGPTLTLFREAFFKKYDHPFKMYEYKFDNNKQAALNRMLHAGSIEYEATGLPRTEELVCEYDLPEDAASYYEKAKQRLIASHGNVQEQENAYLRMRQISSGFVGYKDDELGEKCKFRFDQNPKLDGLIAKIKTIRPDHKIVLFHQFIFSGDMIEEAFIKEGIGYVRMNKKVKDPSTVLDRFDNDPNCQVFLVSNSQGAYGLNLQVALYLMYFESPDTPILRTQTRRRVERQRSQHRSVFILDFVMRGTADEKILESLKEGEELFAGIVRGRIKFGRL